MIATTQQICPAKVTYLKTSYSHTINHLGAAGSTSASAKSKTVLNRQTSDSPKLRGQLDELRALQANHSLWQSPLIKAFQSGHLTLADLKFIFGQYSFYCRNFTRYLAAFMANTDNDMHRAQLVENLWEESGGTELSQRHAELYRQFLIQGLGLDLERLQPIPATQVFVDKILAFCMQSAVCESAAFLALGTEGIVPRMYEAFVKGLRSAGVAEDHLTFFNLHIACDDDHAITLEQIMLSYANQPGWFESCHHALTVALNLREQFFEGLYQQIQIQRVQPILDRIQDRQSLARCHQTLHYPAEQPGTLLYRNQGNKSTPNIDFAVERLVVPSEVLDPRVVRIAPHKTNERHRHAHEALFVIKAGKGKVLIDQEQYAIKSGDTVFVPRWAVHQMINTGDGPLVMLAITDFRITSQAFVGNYLHTARMRSSQDSDYRRLLTGK